MIMAILNLLLGITETFFLIGCMFYFLGHNHRTIFRKRSTYVCGFIGTGMLTFLLLLLDWTGISGLAFHYIAILVLGIWLFHRRPIDLILDLVFLCGLSMVQEAGIYLANFLELQVLKTNDVLFYGNLAISIKMIIDSLYTWIFTKVLGKWMDAPLTLKETFTILILPAFSLFFFFSLLRMQLVYVQLYGMTLLFLNATALIALNFYFLYLFRQLFKVRKLENQMKVYEAQNEIRYRYYDELEKKYQESRKVIHDMKNHLQAVEKLYREGGEDQGDQYVKDLYHMLNVLGEKYYSSNKMLNILLNDKFSAARRKGIQVEAEVGDVIFDDIRDMDITTIFGNLLDNALEGAEAFGEGAFLKLKIDRVQEFRVISLENTCRPGEKKQKGHMGLGLQNVQNILNQYHGTLNKVELMDRYRVHIMIPEGVKEKY